MTTIKAETEQRGENESIWLYVNNEPSVHLVVYKAKNEDKKDRVYLTVWQKGIDSTTTYP